MKRRCSEQRREVGPGREAAGADDEVRHPVGGVDPGVEALGQRVEVAPGQRPRRLEHQAVVGVVLGDRQHRPQSRPVAAREQHQQRAERHQRRARCRPRPGSRAARTQPRARRRAAARGRAPRAGRRGGGARRASSARTPSSTRSSDQRRPGHDRPAPRAVPNRSASATVAAASAKPRKSERGQHAAGDQRRAAAPSALPGVADARLARPRAPSRRGAPRQRRNRTPTQEAEERGEAERGERPPPRGLGQLVLERLQLGQHHVDRLPRRGRSRRPRWRRPPTSGRRRAACRCGRPACRVGEVGPERRDLAPSAARRPRPRSRLSGSWP